VRLVLWMVAAIALILSLVALALRSSAGYVQIVLPPHRVELSLSLTIAVLLAGFALAYLMLRLVLAMVAMPRHVRGMARAASTRQPRCRGCNFPFRTT